MTGVRARRVDDAEVKLDTAFYRLRERFFGSRVGSLALSAVAFNLGTNRGMVCGTVSCSASDPSLAGERVRSAQGSSKGLSNELLSRSQRRVSSVRAHAKRANPARCLASSSRTSQPKQQRRTGGTVRGGLFERRRQFACWQRAGMISFALLPWSMQPKSTRRSCGDLNSRVRQVTNRCARSQSALGPAKHLCVPESA